MIRKGQASQCAPGGMAILVHCFLSWSVRCEPATATSPPLTNLQHSPLNGGGTIELSLSDITG
jgi:hypothetical protein